MSLKDKIAYNVHRIAHGYTVAAVNECIRRSDEMDADDAQASCVFMEQVFTSYMERAILEALFPTSDSGKALLDAYERILFARSGDRSFKDSNNDRFFTFKRKEGGK